jgi:hypothetical protein
MRKLDLKKDLKAYYNAKSAPVMIDIPSMKFLMIDGTGNPNTSAAYVEVVQALYSVAYTLKFTIKKELQIDYPVMPLEGLWWSSDLSSFLEGRKDDWIWTMMISTPDFITQNMIDTACEAASRKKSLPSVEKLRFECFKEGLSFQILHIGPYSAEDENIRILHNYIHANNYSFEGHAQKHHEIYLGDPRKSAPEKLKTIIRQPVKS